MASRGPDRPPQLMQTVIDAPDHRRLAEFYRELLSYRYREGSEPGPADDPVWIEIEDGATGQRLAFQQGSRHRPPDWPEHHQTPTQMHLDVSVPNRQALEAAVAQARSLGATVLSTADEPDGLIVLADPAGHPLCILIEG